MVVISLWEKVTPTDFKVSVLGLKIIIALKLNDQFSGL